MGERSSRGSNNSSKPSSNSSNSSKPSSNSSNKMFTTNLLDTTLTCNAAMCRAPCTTNCLLTVQPSSRLQTSNLQSAALTAQPKPCCQSSSRGGDVPGHGGRGRGRAVCHGWLPHLALPAEPGPLPLHLPPLPAAHGGRGGGSWTCCQSQQQHPVLLGHGGGSWTCCQSRGGSWTCCQRRGGGSVS